MVWQYKNATAERKYLVIESYALKLYSDNEKLTTGKLDLNEIRAKVEQYSKDNTATLGTTWDQLDEQVKNGIDIDADTKAIMDLPFTKDSNGVYRNLNTLGLPLVSEEEVKEIREELIGANVLKTYDFTNKNTVIPAEQKVFASYQNQFESYQIDYNDLLNDIGYIPDSLVDIAANQGLTTYEFLEHRMKAFGKTIDPKFKKFLNEEEVSTLPSAMKLRLLGKIKDGKYTDQEIPAYLSKESDLAGFSLINTFQEAGENWIDAIGANYDLALNDEGAFTTDVEANKTFIGFQSGLGMSLNNEIFNDFAEGGEAQFVGAIKENLNWADVPQFLKADEIGFNAFSTSGNIDFLPVLDSLQDTKGEDNLNKLLTQLRKFWEEEEDTGESTLEGSGEEEVTESTTGTDLIDESLNNN